MNDTTNPEATTGDADPRQDAARQLAMVGVLQMHQLRRAMRAGRGAPWQDPRQGQGRVLALLKLQPQTTQKELTYLLGMSRQSLAELLAKLERQGLIEREPAPDDKRVVVVRLTEAGAAAEQADESASTAADDLLDALEDAEVTQLAAYLTRMLDHVEKNWPADDPRRARGFGRGGLPGFFGPGPGGPGPRGRGPWGPRGPWAPGDGGPHEHGPHEHGRHGHGPHGPRGPRAGAPSDQRDPHAPHHGPADDAERED